MIELLKLVGYEPEEIETEMPRVEKAFKKIGLTGEDVERAKQRLNKYYDMELKGIRKIFRHYFQELVDMVLAKEEGKKLLAGFMCPGTEIINSGIAFTAKNALMIYMPWTIQIIIGCVFDKLVPILEAAEKKWLKAGVVAHCANIKTFLGLIASGLIPKLDLAATSGFLCEAAPKTLDLMHEVYEIPITCWDTCMDREIGDYAEGMTRLIALGAKSMRKINERVGDIIDVEITDEILLEVIKAKAKLTEAIVKLRGITTTSDPMVLSPTHDIAINYFGRLAKDKAGLEAQVDAINTLRKELEERAGRGEGVVEKGAPRILAILPPSQSDPMLEHLIRELGIALPVMDTGFMVPYELEDIADPFKIAINAFIRSSMLSTTAARIPLIIDACKRLKIDGVLNRFHAGCRSVTGDAMMIEKAIKEELGIPVLTLEWENFDPRVYNHEQFKQKLEVFKTMM